MFIYQGWLDTGFFGRIFKNVRRNGIRIDDSKSHDNQLASQRAVEEEARRKEERTARRSFEKAARNVEVYNFKKSMISQAPSSGTKSQTQYLSFLRRPSGAAQSQTPNMAELNPMQMQKK